MEFPETKLDSTSSEFFLKFGRKTVQSNSIEIQTLLDRAKELTSLTVKPSKPKRTYNVKVREPYKYTCKHCGVIEVCPRPFPYHSLPVGWYCIYQQGSSVGNFCSVSCIRGYFES